MTLTLLLLLIAVVPYVLVKSASCPITNTTNIVYSKVSGVGGASLIWVQNLLAWWKAEDLSINYLGLTAVDIQSCDLASFNNLRVYINPGGDAYNQLTSLGAAGTAHIKEFVTRDQSSPSAYVGFCAGGYMAAHDYLWETMYEGPGYYNYATVPPLSIFPHTVEGSLVDVNDDQFGDQFSSKFRMVNVSNGHRMLYYGGSTFGYNGVADFADKSSPLYDPKIEVLIYYSDFYGHNAVNIPAAWKYGNIVLTSVHPEADDCTPMQDSDCPPTGTVPAQDYLRNRAWICKYINDASQSKFNVPVVDLLPVYDTTAPHISYPEKSCYKENPSVLFCDDFDVLGRVAEGLSPQFQRNQTDYNHAQPWNVTYLSSWNGKTYASPHTGNGYAVCVAQASTAYQSSITTKPIDASKCTSSNRAKISFAYTGSTLSNGYLRLEYAADAGTSFKTLVSSPLSSKAWESSTYTVTVTNSTTALRFRFSCSTGSASTNYCAVDTLFVSCA